MTLRQAVAFSATALILHLGFVARESRCTPEGAQAPAPTEHHQQHSEQPAAPTVPVCCQALTSCAVTAAVTSAETILLGASSTAPLVNATFNPSLTRSFAPDAPPPRA